MGNYNVIVIDFETSGLSPNLGDRTIEVGAVLVENNQIIDRYQSLMNPGKKIPVFIEQYTGITNKMLATAPSIAEVMEELKSFVGNHPIVAHNAAFDLRFLDAEFERIKHKRKNEAVCSLLTSRRIFTGAPDYKLETLVKYKNLNTTGIHHRALADAEMTAHLWVSLLDEVKTKFHLKNVPFSLVQKIAKTPKNKVPELLRSVS